MPQGIVAIKAKCTFALGRLNIPSRGFLLKKANLREQISPRKEYNTFTKAVQPLKWYTLFDMLFKCTQNPVVCQQAKLRKEV